MRIENAQFTTKKNCKLKTDTIPFCGDNSLIVIIIIASVVGDDIEELRWLNEYFANPN